MANILYKYGRWIAQHKVPVLIAWLLILGVILTPLFIDKPEFSNDIKMTGLKSLDTNDKIQDKFGIDSEKATLRLVLKSDSDKGIVKESTIAEVKKSIKDLKKRDKKIDTITDPYEMKIMNKDQTTTFVDINYDVTPMNLSDQSIDKVKDEVKDLKENTTLQVEMTGNALSGQTEIGGLSEVIGISFAFIILLITFASLVAAGMPIFSALIGLLAGIGIIGSLTHFFDIPNITLSLASMIGLALGIDYALFILYRYRKIKATEPNSVEAIGRAVGTAGGAVIFAGLTVMIAVCGLALVGIDFLSIMGISSALSALFAVLTSLTLVPALISLFHKRIEPPAVSYAEHKNPDTWWSKFVLGHPWLASILGILLLASLIIPFTDMRLGIPDDGMKNPDSTERKAYDIISDDFGEGFNAPIPMLVKTTENKDNPEKLQKNLNALMNDINKMKNVDTVTPPQMTKDNNYALITILPEKGPNDKETVKLSENLRDYNEKAKDKYQFNTEISGQSVINIDMSEKLKDAIPLFAGVIIALALLLLTIVFRSLLVPVLAVLGFVLSLVASLGFTTLVMQEGWMNELFGISQSGPVLAFLPVITIGLLFGLAMDYEVFLMSRVHEEYAQTKDTLHSLKIGLKESGPVIVAAALIMFSVFISFVFQDDIMIKAMGIALSFGVLFDAFIVRLMIIPALTLLLGKKSWYLPRALDRILPKVDIEGHNLQAQSDVVSHQVTNYEVPVVEKEVQTISVPAHEKVVSSHEKVVSSPVNSVHTTETVKQPSISNDSNEESEIVQLLKQQSENIKDLNALIKQYFNH